MLAYNENSGVECIVSFFDATHLATLPTTVHWRLDCQTTGRSVLDWAQVTPNVTINSSGVSEVTALIEIPGSANVIINRRNRREVKTLLVVADKDLSSEFSQEYSYYVKDVLGR